MNIEEKRNAVVGSIVIAVVAAMGALLLFGPNRNSASDKYVVISEFPQRSGLEVGSGVFIGDKRVGEVQKLSENGPGPDVAVRMKVAGETFDALGADSKAWILPPADGSKARIIISPGGTPERSRFIKIKPVKGIRAPAESGH